MKKAMMILFGCVLALLLVMGVSAQGITTAEENEVMETVQAWLTAYTSKVFLYEDCDLSTLTVAELPAAERAGLRFQRSLYTANTRATDSGAMSRTTDSIAYLLDKAEYFSQMRQMQGITREDFEVTYRFGDVTISGNSAAVSVTETKTFRYSDVDFKTCIAEVFDVYLVKAENEWLVYDVCTDDGFDGCFKADGFQLAEKLEAVRAASANTTPGEPVFKKGSRRIRQPPCGNFRNQPSVQSSKCCKLCVDIHTIRKCSLNVVLQLKFLSNQYGV